MNDRLNQIVAQLDAELTQIEAALRGVEQERERLVAERERVASSLTALRPAKAPSGKRRGQPHKPCATKREVAAVVRRLVEQNGPCPEEDLIGLAEDRLREEGKSLSGFKLRYRGVRRELLTESPDGRLALKVTDSGASAPNGSVNE